MQIFLVIAKRGLAVDMIYVATGRLGDGVAGGGIPLGGGAEARIDIQRAFGDAVRGRIVAYTTFGGFLLLYASSLAEFKAERYAPGSHITNYSDAVWWAVALASRCGRICRGVAHSGAQASDGARPAHRETAAL